MSTEIAPWGRKFTANKAIFSFLGNAFRIYGPEGNLRFYVKQKAFKLKEDINVFADENQSDLKLNIKARSWGDFSGTYDVNDVDGTALGSAKREGFKSMLRDSWLVMGKGDEVIAKLEEDSMLMAMVRRVFLKGWIPQGFTVRSSAGEVVGVIKQRFNPFRLTYDVDFEMDKAGVIDSRLAVGLVVLLLAIEGRQN